MPIVMRFGLLPPAVNADAVATQMSLAHKYRNRLVEIERERRRMIREAEAPYGIRAKEGALKDLGLQRSKARKQGEDVKPIEEAIKAAKAELVQLRQTPALVARMLEINGKPPKPPKAKDEKRSRAESRNTDKTRNDGLAAKTRRAARAASGLYWGTYLCVEDAAGRSFADVGGLYDGDEDNDPRFAPWRGEGRVGVQIQSTKPLADIFGEDARVSIAPVDDLALTSPIRSERRKAARTTLRMIVDGDLRQKINPTAVYAEWPMMLHRPIPSDARITWVKVSKRMVGPRAEWSCEITLERTAAVPVKPARGAVAVVFGWRAVEDGKVRVAHWMSTDGEIGTLDISTASLSGTDCDGGRGGIVSGFRRVETLHATRERNFNVARNALVEWLRTLPEVPEWMRARTSRENPTSAQALAYLAQWKAPGKLATFVRAWAANRVDGDATAFAAAEAWRHHDFHLWQWEESQRKGASRRRNDVYRVAAAKLADKYASIIVDGTNFKAMREEETAKVDKRVAEKSQSLAQIVSCGMLRDTIKNAATQRGRAYEKVNPGKSAQRCPKCETTEKVHRGEDHMFACTHCTYVRDVATTRLLNMLRDAGFVTEVAEIIRKGEQAAETLRRKVA